MLLKGPVPPALRRSQPSLTFSGQLQNGFIKHRVNPSINSTAELSLNSQFGEPLQPFIELDFNGLENDKFYKNLINCRYSLQFDAF